MKRNFKNIRVDYQVITEKMSEIAAMWSLDQDELLYTYKFGNDKKEEFGSYILHMEESKWKKALSGFGILLDDIELYLFDNRIRRNQFEFKM